MSLFATDFCAHRPAPLASNLALYELIFHIRGLNFTKLALQNSQADANEELSVSFNKSYDATLKKYHGIMVRPVFAVRVHTPNFIVLCLIPSSIHQLAMKACPYRNDFYTKLGPKDKVDAEFGPWLNSLDVILKRMNAFYASGTYGGASV